MYRKIISGLILLIIGSSVCYALYRVRLNRALNNNAEIGQQIPDFRLFNLVGKKMTREALAGKKYILLFYSTACDYCQSELSQIDKLQLEFGNNLLILPVSLNSVEETERARQDWKLSLTPFADGRVIARQLGIQGTPTLVFVGDDSRIAYRYSGSRKPEFQRFIIEQFLKGHSMTDEGIRKGFEKILHR